jgi:hypothetical protein
MKLEELAERVVAEGFRNPEGLHNQPPFEPWPLTDKGGTGPWGIRSRTGVNCLGAFKIMGGMCFAPRQLAETICETLCAQHGEKQP